MASVKKKNKKAKAGYELETSTCVRLAPSGFLLKLLLSRFSISDYHLQCVCMEEVGPPFLIVGLTFGIPGRLSSVSDLTEKKAGIIIQ